MRDIYPDSGNLAVLTALGGVGGPFAGAKVRWWAAAVTPNPDTVLANLPAAGFSGNADSAALTYGAGLRDRDANWKLPAGSKQVVQTGTGTVSDLNGWLLVGDPSGTPYLLASRRYDDTANMISTGRGDVVTPSISLTDGVDSVVYSRPGRIKGLILLSATGKFLDGAVIRLGQNVTAPTSTDGLSAYTECDFTGYAESAPLVWGSPFIDSDGATRLAAGSVQFTAGVITVSQSVTCWYMVGDPGGTEYLIRAGWLDTPVLISEQYDGVIVTPEYELRAAG